MRLDNNVVVRIKAILYQVQLFQFTRYSSFCELQILLNVAEPGKREEVKKILSCILLTEICKNMCGKKNF